MIENPVSKLDYLLIYFDLLTKTKQEDRFIKWNGEELVKVAEEIQKELKKFD